ncbi:MAG: hypothetical protein A2854_01280 [Parcubacteria group bacterium RIFCSPHIGHO2_01_FULL_56_18]|nr:MAG: hypothetical protein A2854_01280 [Parcubacteria group bacterium RIFCSPHIGHO2_01_FULL_56_18]
MKKYFALYLAPAEETKRMMANFKPEDGIKAMEEWGKWIDAHKAAIIDTEKDYVALFEGMWPKALARLKEIAEK